MDLNTGTPIQPPSAAIPPTPQQSPTLPTMPPAAVEQVPKVPEEISMPPVSDSPTELPPLDEDAEHSPAFIDTLSALKNFANSKEVSAPAEPPTPPVIPVQPLTAQSQPIPVKTSQAPIQPKISSPVPPQKDTRQAGPMKSDPLPDASFAKPMPVGNIPAPGNYETRALLDLVVQREASDLHIVVGYPPMIRIDGALVTVGDKVLTPQLAKELIYAVLPDDKKEQLEVNREVDLAYQHETAGRFRINAYWQRGYISGAFRLIPTRIRSIDELKLPELFHKFTDMEQGLVLVTGPTGHGKSTTLAAVIQEINTNHPKHILTIEDPIEYVFPQQRGLVSQRELGDDTHSWKGALRSALREDPDVVLIGEMRDLETISSAITVAETGHLVFATLHTNNAAQTIQRIVNMYPDAQQDEIRSELADVLEAVVAQRLIPIVGGGRRAALEIMLMTPAIRNLIRENKIYQIDNIIRTSLDVGMITLERSLLTLYRDGLIQQDDALRYALDPTEMSRLLEELV